MLDYLGPSWPRVPCGAVKFKKKVTLSTLEVSPVFKLFKLFTRLGKEKEQEGAPGCPPPPRIPASDQSEQPPYENRVKGTTLILIDFFFSLLNLCHTSQCYNIICE